MGRRLTARGSTRSGRWGLTTNGGKGSPGTRRAEPPQGIDEADPLQGHALPLRRCQHDHADQVVDQGKDGQLLEDPDEALTVQHIQAHRLLEVPQIGLDLPAHMVQFGQGVRWIQVDLQEGGDQRHRLRPKAGLGHAVAQFAHAEHRRERGKQLGRHPGRWVHGQAHGFHPLDELVGDTQLAEPAGAGQPLLRACGLGVVWGREGVKSTICF